MKEPTKGDSFWDDLVPILMPDNFDLEVMVHTGGQLMMQNDSVHSTPLVSPTPLIPLLPLLPLPQPSDDKRKKPMDSSSTSESGNDRHRQIERERRKKMGTMFDELRSLVPNLDHKSDQSEIIDETILHINKLKATLFELEKEKDRRAKLKATNRDKLGTATKQIQPQEFFLSVHNGPTGNSSSQIIASNSKGNHTSALGFSPLTPIRNVVVLNMNGKRAQISFTDCRKKRHVMSNVASIMERYHLEVENVTIASGMYTIVAQAKGGEGELTPGMLLFVGDRFKLAVNDIDKFLNA